MMHSNTAYYHNAITAMVAEAVTQYQKTGTHLPIYLAVSPEVFRELQPDLYPTDTDGVYHIYAWLQSTFSKRVVDLQPIPLVCNELLQPYSFMLRCT